MKLKLNDWLAITDGRVTEGSEFGFQCYGERAYSLTYWNQLHGEAEVSTHVVYDRSTFEVYEAEAYDGAREITYIWRPQRAKYEAELKASNPTYFCEWTEVVLESLDDFIEKATAIVNGDEYDNRIKVPINFDDSELLALMMEAHRRDMTFNELVEFGLRQAINAELDKGEAEASTPTGWTRNADGKVSPPAGTVFTAQSATAWPFNFDQLISRVTWVNGEAEDFIGIWNTIKDMEIVSADYGQFCGGITSHNYETPVYEYTVIWYDGDTDKVPDEITRVNK